MPLGPSATVLKQCDRRRPRPRPTALPPPAPAAASRLSQRPEPPASRASSGRQQTRMRRPSGPLAVVSARAGAEAVLWRSCVCWGRDRSGPDARLRTAAADRVTSARSRRASTWMRCRSRSSASARSSRRRRCSISSATRPTFRVQIFGTRPRWTTGIDWLGTANGRTPPAGSAVARPVPEHGDAAPGAQLRCVRRDGSAAGDGDELRAGAGRGRGRPGRSSRP